MTGPSDTALADQHSLGDAPIPRIVLEIASGRPAELVWRNDLGGMTFRIGDTFVKWNPPQTGIDLERMCSPGTHRPPATVASSAPRLERAARAILRQSAPSIAAIGRRIMLRGHIGVQIHGC